MAGNRAAGRYHLFPCVLLQEQGGPVFTQPCSYTVDQAIENYNRINAEKHASPVELINNWLENNITYSEPLKRAVKIMFEYSDKRDESPSRRKRH